MHIIVAVEDLLSKSIVEKLLAFSNKGYVVSCFYIRSAGDLKKSLKGFNEASKINPFLVLTDLDRIPCAIALKEDWFKIPQHSNLIFRIAVREVEAWLLADSKNLAKFLSISQDTLPNNVETIDDPKQTLIHLAQRSRSRNIKEGIVPRTGSTAKVGPDYNNLLSSFVRESWDISIARNNSRSLNKAILHLETYHYTAP